MAETAAEERAEEVARLRAQIGGDALQPPVEARVRFREPAPMPTTSEDEELEAYREREQVVVVEQEEEDGTKSFETTKTLEFSPSTMVCRDRSRAARSLITYPK